MGCVIDRSQRIHPVVTEEIRHKNYINKVCVMLVSQSTLNLLHEIRELPKGTYNIITPSDKVQFGNISIDHVADGLETPRTTPVLICKM